MVPCVWRGAAPSCLRRAAVRLRGLRRMAPLTPASGARSHEQPGKPASKLPRRQHPAFALPAMPPTHHAPDGPRRLLSEKHSALVRLLSVGMRNLPDSNCFATAAPEDRKEPRTRSAPPASHFSAHLLLTIRSKTSSPQMESSWHDSPHLLPVSLAALSDFSYLHSAFSEPASTAAAAHGLRQGRPPLRCRQRPPA